MARQQSDPPKLCSVELVFPADLTPRQCRAHAHRIAELMLSQIDEQTWDNLSALRAGFVPDMPFRISLDFRHAPLLTELPDGAQLLDSLGQPYSRDEVIRLLRQTLLVSWLDDIRVNGETIMPAKRTSFFHNWV